MSKQTHLQSTSTRPLTPPGPTHVSWLNPIKGLALAWIVLNHIAERLFGFPYVGNPGSNWPSLATRIEQLTPLAGYGAYDWPFNALRYLGWFGDFGVSLFLLISGFGLAYGLAQRNHQSPDWIAFMQRRLRRLYPSWWWAHLVFILPLAFIGVRFSLVDPALWWSLSGLRLTPALLYYGAPAWWFVGLLLQLYLVFPLLWWLLQRCGTRNFLIASLLTMFICRALGLWWLDDAIDFWSRGGVFITRLGEFTTGMVMAIVLGTRPDAVTRLRDNGYGLLFAVVAVGVAVVSSLTLTGMVFAPWLAGVSCLVILLWCFARRTQDTGWLATIGRWSLPIFLVHHPLILVLCPDRVDPEAPERAVIAIGVSIVAIIVASAGFDWSRGVAARVWHLCVNKTGRIGLACLLLATLAIWLGSEATVRHFAPQETPELGWGERASLQPDDALGWKMKPNRQTRLRWRTYDYTVTSNSLGFPGPPIASAIDDKTWRIFVTGDAFTSAEGVNTDQAWPRLLQANLNDSGKRATTMMNFAVTGYGPDQYASVIQRYGERAHPDMIIVALSITDFSDAVGGRHARLNSIGFDQPAVDGWAGWAVGAHLRRYVRNSVVKPLIEATTGWVSAEARDNLQLDSLASGDSDIWQLGVTKTRESIQRIQQFSDELNAQLVIVYIPSAGEVCSADTIAYLDGRLNLNDSDAYDLQRASRTMATLARDARALFIDTTPALKKVKPCLAYQAANMHFTEQGHRSVAHWVHHEITRTLMRVRSD